MKFKKICAVLGACVLASASVATGLMAASYPDTFTDGNYAVVYGTGTGVSALDQTQAQSIDTDLRSKVTTTGNIVVTGGDSYKIEKTSTKFHLGDDIGDVLGSAKLDEDQLPTLLATGKYVDSDNEEKDYTQEIKLNNASDGVQLKMFNDNTYARDEPTLGFRLTNNQALLNYTLDFTDKPAFDKLETTEMPLMGKEYYVLTVNSANTTLTLLDSAESTTLSEGETKTVGGKEVSIAFIGAAEVKLNVDGETTNTLAESETYKLSDGSYVGIKDIAVQDYAGGVKNVEFSLGAGKLTIENGVKVQINDEDVKNVYGHIVNATNTLDDIVIEWKANGETFITADQEITMPGFEAVKLAFGGIDFPTEETFTVESAGNDYVALNGFPMMGGSEDIPILGKAAGNTNYSFVGEDTDLLMITSATSTLTWDGTGSTNDSMFVATWADTNDAESYLVRATGFTDPTTGDDTVDIEYNDGSDWVTKYNNAKQDDEVSFGNVELTLATVTSTTDSEQVVFTGGSGVSFDELYTKEGLKIQLPHVVTAATDAEVSEPASCAEFIGNNSLASTLTADNTILGYSNVNVYNATDPVGNVTCSYYPRSTYGLLFTEENKDEDKGVGYSFNITIGNNGASNYYASVTDVNNNTVTREKDDTDVYQSWMYSALATKFVEYDAGDQDYVEVTYHGGEAMAGVYVTSSDATVGTDLGTTLYTDAEKTSWQNKNVVIVGGSCINSAAATALGVASGTCGDAFEAATGVGSGQFLIKTVDGAFASGKTALVVAGYNAEDTVKATSTMKNTEAADGTYSTVTGEVVTL